MNDKDFQQHIYAIKQLLGLIQTSGDERHISIFAQIYQLLNNMDDECDNRIRQQQLTDTADKTQ